MKKTRPLYRTLVATALMAAGLWIGGDQLFARDYSDKQTTPSAPHSEGAQKNGEQVFMQN